MLMPLLHSDYTIIPLDRISVPVLGYKEWEELSPVGSGSMLVEYSENSKWSFNLRPVCVSYTEHGNEERYVIFRLKEHTPGERMVIEYSYVQPADP
jgi:hypothetical protein